MIYVLKGLYSFLLPPGLLIAVFAVVGVWLMLRKHRFAGIISLVFTMLLYLSSLPIIGETAMSTLENRYAPPASIDGDVYVVLTGGAVAGVPDLGGVGQLGGETLARVETTAELYHKNQLPVLVSGGQVYEDTANEGQLSKRKLIALGVPERDILLDDTSRTTLENAEHSKQILQKSGLHRPVLITSAFHMLRAVKHFRDQQVEVIPYPTGYLVSRSPGMRLSKLLPSAGAMNLLSMTFKEYIGLLQK